MARQYIKMEELSEAVFARKAAGETNSEIAKSYGLTKEQIKGLVSRQNRKARKIALGYIPRKKGRPRKAAATEEARMKNELAQLRMTVEVLRNFQLEIGGR